MTARPGTEPAAWRGTLARDGGVFWRCPHRHGRQSEAHGCAIREADNPGAADLGEDLRRHRHRAELTITQVAEALECSDSKVSRIETGHVRVTPRDVRDLLDLYGVTGPERDRLIDVARRGRAQATTLRLASIAEDLRSRIGSRHPVPPRPGVAPCSAASASPPPSRCCSASPRQRPPVRISSTP